MEPTVLDSQAFSAIRSTLFSKESFLPPKLAEYTDFRKYLKDVYDYRRLTEATGARPYSYSTFSAAADIRSPNYLKLIIEGKRNLSPDMIWRFGKALRLSREETNEFAVLVNYGQCDDPLERNKYLKQLSELRSQRDLQEGQIDQKSWDKVPDWIGWILYAMADQVNTGFSPEQLQKLIRPRVDLPELRAALEKLISAGELENGPNGEMRRARELMESPQDLPVSQIRKLQADLIYLGIESLFKDSPKEREFGGLTLALTQEEYEQVRFELRQMRKRIHKDVMTKRRESKGERVYQLNVQLFPVTDKADWPSGV